MTKEKPWFYDERAMAYAKLVLTEHDDVAIRPYAPSHMAIDLLAEILKDGKPTTRFFAAQVISCMDLPATVSSHSLERNLFETGLPICAFWIGVRKLEGLYTWVVEPAVEQGHAKLVRHSSIVSRDRWRTIDNAGTRRLVAEVNAYYDALAEKPAGKAPRRAVKSGS